MKNILDSLFVFISFILESIKLLIFCPALFSFNNMF